jgi:Pyridoxamine 5'-phosphate oxidase
VLATTGKDGSPYTSPVWFRWTGEVFEVVIALRDVKLRHLERDTRCLLAIFEAVPPFRGVEVRGEASLTQGDVTEARRSIGRPLPRPGRRRAFRQDAQGPAGRTPSTPPDRAPRLGSRWNSRGLERLVEDVQRVAQDVVASHDLKLALIAPFDDAERFEKLLA